MLRYLDIILKRLICWLLRCREKLWQVRIVYIWRRKGPHIFDELFNYQTPFIDSLTKKLEEEEHGQDMIWRQLNLFIDFSYNIYWKRSKRVEDMSEREKREMIEGVRKLCDRCKFPPKTPDLWIVEKKHD